MLLLVSSSRPQRAGREDAVRVALDGLEQADELRVHPRAPSIRALDSLPAGVTTGYLSGAVLRDGSLSVSARCGRAAAAFPRPIGYRT
jgi:hypothetical protein